MTRSSDRRIQQRYDPLLTEPVVLAVGPQHPSLPAPLQLQVQADGELVQRITVDCGYMHRGVEKLCEGRSYASCAALLSRCEWLAGSNGDYLVSAAVEELCGIEVPERAQWLRTLVLELSRISSHLFWFAKLGLEAGAITPMFYSLRERELFLDAMEELTGARMHHGWIIPGGVRTAPSERFITLARAALSALRTEIESYENFFSDNAIWVNRSELIGVLEADYAMRHGASGPVLRGSGVAHDLRKDSPYLVYDKLQFNVPVGEIGDVLDRYRVRFIEMRESIRLAEQCIEFESFYSSMQEESEDPASTLFNRRAVPTDGTVPKGETYIAVEGPRGELGLSVVSNGTARPERMHLRGPSLAHLMLMDELCRGYLLADIFVIYGSLDIMVGEVDR